VAATRAAEAKKAAEAKETAADPADMASSRGQATTAAKSADAAGATTDADASASAAGPTATEATAEPVSEKGPEEQAAAKEGGSPAAPPKERRKKAARDSAHREDPLAPKGGAPSTEAVLHATAPEAGDEFGASRQAPLASLSFAEIHKVLGDVHEVSVVL
jgi:hypothetical protein